LELLLSNGYVVHVRKGYVAYGGRWAALKYRFAEFNENGDCPPARPRKSAERKLISGEIGVHHEEELERRIRNRRGPRGCGRKATAKGQLDATECAGIESIDNNRGPGCG
jgi:hypothetical protein